MFKSRKASSLSDAVFSASCLYLAYIVQNISIMSAIGAGTLGLASLSGSIRFLADRRSKDDIVKLHDLLTRLSATCGIPLMNAGILIYKLGYKQYEYATIGAVMAVTVVSFSDHKFSRLGELMSAVSFLAMLVYGDTYMRAGVGLVLLGAGYLGDAGVRGGHKVDVFHYFFAIANGLYIKSLTGW
eukprot:TRINITY_DN6500_c0_g1_i1.p1 TRINITY_DN6500_c0_g1~~TRINITY_DN6500_c0_g1_i1.p1  ORF type:complete len:185 (-),score=22.56 TRINITY_DN6500_c0_g1_i1:44-598(-)